jgi:hypothetical protein
LWKFGLVDIQTISAVNHVRDADSPIYRTFISDIAQQAFCNEIVEIVDFASDHWIVDEPTAVDIQISRHAVAHLCGTLRGSPPLKRTERTIANCLETSVGSVENFQKHAMRRLHATMADL